MITLIIRDDDINYFTPEWALEKIYGDCWKENIPVCFSVIPSVLSQKKYNLGYHPFIPKEYIINNQSYPININLSLCNYLNEKVKNNQIEICLHGFDHSLNNGISEFSINEGFKIRQKIIEGKNILKKGMPSAKIKTFVPPFDKISKIAIQIVLKEGLNLTMNPSIKHLIVFFHILSVRNKFIFLRSLCKYSQSTQIIKVNSSKIFLHHSYWFSQLFSSCKINNIYRLLTDELLKHILSDKIFVIVNHHWEFFNLNDKVKTSLLDEWHYFINFLFNYKKRINFSTFFRFNAVG